MFFSLLLCHRHLARKIVPFVRYSISFCNSNFLEFKAPRMPFFSFSSILLDSAKRCKLLISLSSSSYRDILAFLTVEYFRDSSLIFSFIISHIRASSTKLSFLYSS